MVQMTETVSAPTPPLKGAGDEGAHNSCVRAKTGELGAIWG